MIEKTLWHPVALSESVAQAPLAASLLEQELVLWRDDSGQVQAWDERCPHCSAAIRVSRPRHGGTAISEVLPSGRLIPHPCFDRLRGKRAGRETLDLFFDWSPG